MTRITRIAERRGTAGRSDVDNPSILRPTAMSQLKKWIVIGASAGAGIAVVGACIIAGVMWYASRPAGWNTTDLSVVSGIAEAIYNFDDSNTFKQSGFDLDFAVQNNTNRDITIPVEVSIMERLAEGGVLADYSMVAKLHKPVFIPARQRAQLSISTEWGCSQIDDKRVASERDPGVCYKDNFGAIDALVLFDALNHIQLTLPKPALKEFPPHKVI